MYHVLPWLGEKNLAATFLSSPTSESVQLDGDLLGFLLPLLLLALQPLAVRVRPLAPARRERTRWRRGRVGEIPDSWQLSWRWLWWVQRQARKFSARSSTVEKHTQYSSTQNWKAKTKHFRAWRMMTMTSKRSGRAQPWFALWKRYLAVRFATERIFFRTPKVILHGRP